MVRCRLPASSQYLGQINEALGQQGIRMDKAAAEERKRKTAVVESRKRPSSNPSEPAENKRIKLENETTQNSSASFLAAFDFTSLPASLITSLIVANLEAFTEPRLISLVDTYRQNWRLGVTTSAQPPMATGSIAMPVPKPAAASSPIQNMSTPSIPTGPRKHAYIIDSTLTPPPQPMAEAAIKDEPVDPLQMDIDEDEFEFEPEKLNEEVCRFVAGVPIDLSSVLASSCLRHLKQKAISWLLA
jgi:symplekin